jgi:hypothetical protein
VTAIRRAWGRASRSDKLVGAGGPIVGLLALVAGAASGVLLTAVIGGAALVSGLLFAIPLIRGTDDEPR